MKIYQAELGIGVEIHADSPEAAARQRERLVQALDRLIAASPAVHALGVLHFRVDLRGALAEKPEQGSPADALRHSDAQGMMPVSLPTPGDRHGAVMDAADRASDDTPAHYSDGGSATASTDTV